MDLRRNRRLVQPAMKTHRRHSALRTINGGICCGLTRRWAARTQFRLLGYHRTLSSSICRANLFFWDLVNITNTFPPKVPWLRLQYYPLAKVLIDQFTHPLLRFSVQQPSRLPSRNPKYR